MKYYAARLILFVFIFSGLSLVTSLAQTNNESASKEAAPLSITRKEVAAVQAELQRRGYYRNQPHGVLDADTREAIITYQKENELTDSGQIDMDLLNSLELKYPATGKEVESARRKGFIPRLGYGVKDTATGARDTTVNAGKSVKRGTEKAYDATTNAVKNAADTTKDKSKELAKDTGNATVKGAKKVSSATTSAAKKTSDASVRAGRKVGDVFVGRSDAEIQSDIRDALEKDEKTARVRSEVKDGAVRLSAKDDVDLGDAVSRIRKVSGVRSVVVIAK